MYGISMVEHSSALSRIYGRHVMTYDFDLMFTVWRFGISYASYVI